MNTERAHHVLMGAVGLVAPGIEPATLDPDRSLREQANLSPRAFLELVALLADALHANIPEDDYRNLDTVEGAVAYLAPRLP
ncbi:MAG: acyl carrier protein [Candidatus Nanopelagicales bacterium]